MLKKQILALPLLLSVSQYSAAEVTAGVGFGIPYGLAGANISTPVDENVDAFVSVGFGVGAGIRARPFENKETSLFVYYGPNAVTSAVDFGFLFGEDSGGVSFEAFSGFNLGVGIGSKDGWNFDIIYAIKSQEFKDEVERLEKDTSVVVGDSTDSEIKLSIGYHW